MADDEEYNPDALDDDQAQDDDGRVVRVAHLPCWHDIDAGQHEARSVAYHTSHAPARPSKQ
jgi:hypothetical protein